MRATFLACILVVGLTNVTGCKMVSFGSLLRTTGAVVSAVAPQDVKEEATRDVQERYGNSPYYDEKVGGISMKQFVDPPSGFTRETGSVVIYNRSEGTVNVQWVGDIASGVRHVEKLSGWNVRADLDVVDKKSGNTIGTLRIDEMQGGRIYVIRNNMVEIR